MSFGGWIKSKKSELMVFAFCAMASLCVAFVAFIGNDKPNVDKCKDALVEIFPGFPYLAGEVGDTSVFILMDDEGFLVCSCGYDSGGDVVIEPVDFDYIVPDDGVW